MSPRLRHLWVAVLSVLALVLLSSCGSDAPATIDKESAAPRLDAVTISGDVGTAPDVTWKSKMTADKLEKKTLVAGTGAAVADGQSVLAQLYIGNGFTKKQAYSSYETGAQILGATDSIPPIVEALKGATIGSRIAVTASSAEAFGEGGSGTQLGIGNADPVLFVVDVLSAVADAPTGAQSPAPSWMPAITFTDGNPSAFDFSKVAKPAGKFRKATLITGDGERVRKNMTVAVRYLGEVYGGTKPFDENYTKTVTPFQIGVGKVIEGWDKQVVGSTVGSRIVIEVPPKLGYGSAGNDTAGIKGTDTLYFVIDILAAG